MIPETHAWNEHQSPVDETEFTPWAEKGWLSQNGQSPEIGVCDFVSKLVRMMRPGLVIETGVGQGYMTRTIVTALDGGQLVAFESDDAWRTMMWPLEFWIDRRFTTTLSPNPTPSVEEIATADLCVFDSEFDHRFQEVVAWDYWAKDRAVALIHDTSDRDGTVHQTLRELIIDLGIAGVFLNNPRGCFLAVQSKRRNDASPIQQ